MSIAAHFNGCPKCHLEFQWQMGGGEDVLQLRISQRNFQSIFELKTGLSVTLLFYLFFSSSSSFLFIMATIASRSSAEKSRDKRYGQNRSIILFINSAEKLLNSPRLQIETCVVVCMNLYTTGILPVDSGYRTSGFIHSHQDQG